MSLTKYIIVSVAVLGRMCLAKNIIEINKPDGRVAAIEDAAIQILTTCYVKEDKTIVLLGNYSARFIQELSSDQNFALVFSDPIKRAQNNIKYLFELNQMKRHKVHIVVMTASYFLQSLKLLIRYRVSGYDDSLASVVILGWSLTSKYAPCTDRFQILDILYNLNVNNLPNTNLICQDPRKLLRIYTLNYFVNQAPAPWQLVQAIRDHRRRYVYLFSRKLNRRLCKNLNFDRTRNLGGSEIRTVMTHSGDNIVKDGTMPEVCPFRRVRLYDQSRFSFIDSFIAYVNASRKYVWYRQVTGRANNYDSKSLKIKPAFLRIKPFIDGVPHTYPLQKDCTTFVTQFRGYKSQLQKILFDVIDHFSWYGVFVVYLITLIFLKYFLRQPPMRGLLNLCRLSCNCGLTMSVSLNMGSQIYIGCLLFFVVTMQGIFQGNLASLLTHDIPERHANSIKDLGELGYTIYAEEVHSVLFGDPAFEGRVVIVPPFGDCIEDARRNASVACVIVGAYAIEIAMKNLLHISSSCIAQEYYVHATPRYWLLQERMDDFLKNAVATETMMPLSVRVELKRLQELDSQEVVLEPEVMTLDNLGFAFVILLIGLVCASIIFIVELMMYRCEHRIRRTRVIVLKWLGYFGKR